MKPFLKLIAILGFVFTFSISNAQQPNHDSSKVTGKQMKMNQAGSADYVTMQDGKMMEYKDKKMIPLQSTYVCTNGDKVSVTGLITMIDGPTRQMKNGDKLYNNGRLMIAKAAPSK